MWRRCWCAAGTRSRCSLSSSSSARSRWWSRTVPSSGPPLPAVALYTLAAVSTWLVTLGATAVAFACYGAGELAGHTRTPAEFAVLAGVLVVAATIGLYAGEHRKALAAVSERAGQAERERLLLASQAVLAERGVIARELHDAIGHHVTLLVVQAGAVRSALPDDHSAHAVLTSMIDARTGGDDRDAAPR